MRMRLIESALIVFADKGIDGAIIENVIELAQVSRGTFYNYFKTNEELLGAVLVQIGNDLIDLVDKTISHRKDPAERLACGLRMVLGEAASHVYLARFATKIGMDIWMHNSLALLYVPRDLRGGIEQGRFAVSDISLAMDLVAGATFAAVYAIATRRNLSPGYPEDVTYHILLGLGMTKASARRLVGIEIDKVIAPPASLLARTSNAFLKRADLQPEAG